MDQAPVTGIGKFFSKHFNDKVHENLKISFIIDLIYWLAVAECVMFWEKLFKEVLLCGFTLAQDTG